MRKSKEQYMGMNEKKKLGILNTPGISSYRASACKHGEVALCIECFYDAIEAIENDYGTPMPEDNSDMREANGKEKDREGNRT